MRGGAVVALPLADPPQGFICGSALVTGVEGDLAAAAAAPPPGGYILMMEGRQLHDGLAPAPAVSNAGAGAAAGAPAVQPGDNNYTLYQYKGILRAIHSSKLPAGGAGGAGGAGSNRIQVHVE